MPEIYDLDPDPARDAEFVRGALRHLVVGNRGRLLDARRTPVKVTGVRMRTGSFEVEVCAFEDAGARWELPFEDVGDFQFARDSSLAPDRIVAELKEAIDCFDRPGPIDCDADVRKATLRRLGLERQRLRRSGALDALPHDIDVAACIATREGDSRLFGLLEQSLAGRRVAEIESRFSDALIRNPRSGEIVKGHEMVLAELGLCPYRGKIARDPQLFHGGWSKECRAQHLLARMAFTQELWSCLGQTTLTLYRGAASDGPLRPPRPRSFVSATLSKDVADAHFDGGRNTQVAVLWRQVVPAERLLMTFLETRAMNQNFKEAEAVLLADPTNRAF